MCHGILHGTEESDRVNTHVLVESLVLGVDKRLEECRVHLLVFYRSTVLVEVFANQLSVSTIYLRGFAYLRVKYSREVTWGTAEEPQEVHVYHSQINKE